MRAVILAAGVGSRLGKPYPKCLNKLPTGETILGRQIRILKENNINEIIIVVGFKMSLIMESFPEVYYRYNPVYYITNTAKSLLCGIKDIQDNVIWINGDVVFDNDVIKRILTTEGNCVGVNKSKCGEEEVKYKLDKDGYISEISKTVIEGIGEAIGVNKISKNDIELFKESLEKCEDNDYFEKGIENIIQQGVKFKPVDISDLRCVEVDFIEDWQLVNDMFKI